MLNQFRRRFVRICMLLCGIVLLLAQIVPAMYFYRTYRSELCSDMLQVLLPLRAEGGRDMVVQSDEFTVVFYTLSTGQARVISRSNQTIDADFQAAAAAVCEKSRDFGVVNNYGLVYYRQAGMNDCKIAFMDAGVYYQALLDYAGEMALIFVLSLALLFFISRFMARIAARPLEEAWQRERRFVADASHELKTPLTVIIANTSILQYSPASTIGEQMRWIDSTASTAGRMRALVDDMLSLSELDAAGEKLQTERVNFSAAAERAVLELEAVAFEKSVTLTAEIDPNLFIEGKASYLDRVIENLVSNAIKYEPEDGEVYVTLHVEAGQAVLRVTNRRTLIATEDLPHVFERFYRTGDALTADGHGLGLSIAKAMTDTMGGTIDAVSTEEAGTTFRVAFKL